jgi:hypothetical protein
VSDDGRLRWPAGKRGLCGDAWNATKFGSPGGVQATYRPGQTINVDALVAINHLGAFKMAVCPLKPGKDGDACVPLLLKAPGHDRTVSWFLPGVKKWEGGNYGGEPPRYGERRRPGGCASRGRLRQRPARGGGGTAPLPLRAPGLALPASLTQTARPPAPLPPPPSLQATARLRSTGCRRSP